MEIKSDRPASADRPATGGKVEKAQPPAPKAKAKANAKGEGDSAAAELAKKVSDCLKKANALKTKYTISTASFGDIETIIKTHHDWKWANDDHAMKDARKATYYICINVVLFRPLGLGLNQNAFPPWRRRNTQSICRMSNSACSSIVRLGPRRVSNWFTKHEYICQRTVGQHLVLKRAFAKRSVHQTKLPPNKKAPSNRLC